MTANHSFSLPPDYVKPWPEATFMPNAFRQETIPLIARLTRRMQRPYARVIAAAWQVNFNQTASQEVLGV